MDQAPLATPAELGRRWSPSRRAVAALVVTASALLLAVPSWADGISRSWNRPPLPASPSAPTLDRLHFDGHGVDIVDPGRRITALVVVNHRLHSTPSNIRWETALEEPGLRRGWLLVYPAGKQASWNSGRCCGSAMQEGVDDTAFLYELVQSLRAQYALDASVPTVMGGVSNGAMETAQFYCRYPGVLQGAFLDAGNAQDPACVDVARVPELLVLRGKHDRMVPIDGTSYSRALGTSLFADSFLLTANRSGSSCRTVWDMKRGGVTSTIEKCGDRTMKVIQDQAGHGRGEAPRVGVVDRTFHTVALIDRVVKRARGGS